MNLILSALVNGAALSLALTAAVWLLLALIPRRVLNAATRYVLWWIVLAVTLLLPAIYLPLPQFHHAPPIAKRSTPSAAIHATLPPPEPSRPAFTIAPSAGFASAAPIHPSRAPIFPLRIDASRWPRWVLFAWLAVSAVLLLRLALSSILLHRIAARALDGPPSLRARARQALALCGVRRPVRLARSDDIPIPAAVGPHRPAILIPSALLEELDGHELHQIVLHEAAHLARYDDYALLFQRILEALLALHPAVPCIARRIDFEREIACDDLVITATGQARSYASCLTRVVELSGGVRSSLAAASAIENASHLSRRVDMLLDKTRHTGTRLLKARLTAMAALVAAMALLATRAPGFVAFATPIARTIQHLPARIVAAVPLLARAEQPQEPPPDFEGRVVEDSSGNPLASAEVRFRKSGMRELTADLDTDRMGRVRASGLPPGDYHVDVVKPNFVTASLQVRVPSTAMLVRLVRYAIISGQVTDTQGKPAPGTIHAPYGRAIGGTRVSILMKGEDAAPLKSVREETIDENGRYRVYDLPPGQYVAGVWYDGLKEGSGFQLYPDNAHPRIFTVTGGEDYSGIDFLVTPHAVYQVSGRIENTEKRHAYALALGLPDQPAFPIAQALTEDDGAFRFERVPVGVYDLFVGGPADGYGAHASVLGPKPVYARQRIQVGQNIENLTLSLNPGRSVDVVLKAHGSDKRPEGCPETATIGITPLEPWGLLFGAITPMSAQPGFDKPQAIKDLAPGRFQLVAGGLPAGCYIVNNPVVDLSSEVTGPVPIELASAGSILGLLRGAAQPSDYAVVLLEDSAATGAQTRLAFPDSHARFSFESLRPGRYRIAVQLASEPKSRWVGDLSRMIEIDIPGGAPTSLELPVPAKVGAR